MKGLLLKDIYTLTKQMKVFLVVLAVFCCIPGYSVSTFAIIYAAMLPITALAYDERSKWNRYAAMMPYTARSMVLSKYVLGYAAISLALLLSFTAEGVANLIRHTALSSDEWLSCLMFSCIAAMMLAINLPLMFRLGVEKGRIFFFITVAAIVVGTVALGDRITAALYSAAAAPLSAAIVLLVAAVAINLLSILLSIRVFQKKA